MSIVTTFPFDNASNYTLNNAQVAGGVGKLGLVDNPGQLFEEDFADDTGFTFNNSLAEFVGGQVQQSDQTPADSVLAALYSSNRDANWNKDGSLTAALRGSPSVSGGKLVCTGDQGVSYSISTIIPQGAAKFKYQPNFSGAPPSNINIFSMLGSVGGERLLLSQSPSGDNFRVFLTNDAGGVLLNASQIGPNSINLQSDTEYEIELNWDNSTGVIRLFLNGALHGSLSPGAWAFSGSATVHMGAIATPYARAEASFDDFVIFDSVQHTSAYTAGYGLPAFIYSNSTVELPAFSYTGLGTIQAVESSTITEAGAPRYIVAGFYWDGSEWTASDGTYAQANDSATVIANLTELNVTGAENVPVSIVFPDTNAQSSVDLVSVTLTGQKFATEGSLLTNSGFVAQEINSFSATEAIKPTGTDIFYIANVNTQDKYWDGSAWVDSDGTSSQANNLSDFQTNITTLLKENSTVKLKVILKTTDQQLTSEIDLLSVDYDFGALAPPQPTQARVYGFLKDTENKPVANAKVTVQANRALDEYTEAADRIITKVSSQQTDDNGFFSFNLIISSEFEVGGAQPMQYKLTIEPENAQLPVFKNGVDGGGNAKDILFEVPNSPEVNITSQIGAI